MFTRFKSRVVTHFRTTGENLELCVMDDDEIVVRPFYPGRRSGADFVDDSNKKHIDIQPTHRRKWMVRE